MATVDEVDLLPDAEQHKLLMATLERVNRVSNAARAAALRQSAFGGAALREIVKEELTRGKLPDGFAKPIADRVELSLQRRAGKQQKFSTYQSLTLPPSAFKWNTSDRVTMLTAARRRTFWFRVDMGRGDLPPPLAGRPAMLTFRN